MKWRSIHETVRRCFCKQGQVVGDLLYFYTSRTNTPTRSMAAALALVVVVGICVATLPWDSFLTRDRTSWEAEWDASVDMPPSHRSHRWSSLDRASIQFLFECVPGKNPDRVRTIQEIMGVGSSRWGSLRVAAAWEVSARLVGQVLLRATDSASTLPWPQPLLPYAQAAGQRYIPTGRSSFLDAAFLTHVRALDNHVHHASAPVRDGTAWFRALAPRQLVWTFLRTGVVDAVQVLEALLGSALVRDMVLVHVPHPVDTARVQGHHPGRAAGMAHGCLDVPGSKTPHIPHAVAILEVRECDHDHDLEHEHEHPNPYTNDCKRTSTDKDPVRYVLQNWWVGDEVWVVDTQWLHRHQCSLVWVASLVPAAPITARNWSDGHANQNPNLNPTGVVESLLCS
jgi:hypothetical protein